MTLSDFAIERRLRPADTLSIPLSGIPVLVEEDDAWSGLQLVTRSLASLHKITMSDYVGQVSLQYLGKVRYERVHHFLWTMIPAATASGRAVVITRLFSEFRLLYKLTPLCPHKLKERPT